MDRGMSRRRASFAPPQGMLQAIDPTHSTTAGGRTCHVTLADRLVSRTTAHCSRHSDESDRTLLTGVDHHLLASSPSEHEKEGHHRGHKNGDRHLVPVQRLEQLERHFGCCGMWLPCFFLGGGGSKPACVSRFRSSVTWCRRRLEFYDPRKRPPLLRE